MEVKYLIFIFLLSLVIQESLSVIELEDDASKGSFLWRIESSPPSYFFGTIHVPYIRVWDAIPNNVKNAFAASKKVYFELDLTKQHTISSLSACQKLPRNRVLSQEIPSELYAKIRIHMENIRKEMPSWVTEDQKRKGFDAQYLFSAITSNWQRKRPIWVTLLINSLTKNDISTRGYPVLDLYLSQLALKNGKRVSSIETVQEQCQPLNTLNKTLVAFALDQTLKQQENLRLGIKSHHFSTDDLIRHYRRGNLDAVIFNQETIMFPSLGHEKSSSEWEDPLTEYEKNLAKHIDEFFREEMIEQRNKRMAHRVIDLLIQNPQTSFFFAFGAAHFVGENTVLDMVKKAGFTIRNVGFNETLPELFAMHGGGLSSQNGRNTVQGTFDDLSEEEKTRAYLQFLQYHQQLEQENETKRFQQMLNRNNNDDNNNNLNEDKTSAANEDFDNNNVSSDDKSENVWYGLSNSQLNLPSISYIIFLMVVILAV